MILRIEVELERIADTSIRRVWGEDQTAIADINADDRPGCWGNGSRRGSCASTSGGRRSSNGGIDALRDGQREEGK